MQNLHTKLVIIDPLNCFMDYERSPLPVKGAREDMDKLALFLRRNHARIDEIVTVLDTHTPDHISHSVRWINRDGDHPVPFTSITSEEYERGDWKATDPADQVWQGEYLKRLTRPHIIWPVHGQKPSWEWQIYEALGAELARYPRKCRYIEKGMHRDTEQFGLFGADVPYPGAPETEINRELIAQINTSDRIIFAGEASSHCVMDSVNQFLAYVPQADWSKVVLLRDCMSPVAGFEQLAEEWLTKMSAKGILVTNSTDLVL